jgi:predicted nucleic acid-binding Zn ribbon protein
MVKCEKLKGWNPLAFLSTFDYTESHMAEFIVVHSIKVATEFVPETFGRLTTIGPRFLVSAGNIGRRVSHQVCKCSCGNLVVVVNGSLQTGYTSSCGCFQKEIASKRATKHGMRGISEYDIWRSMAQRCNNQKSSSYTNYGGRGIVMCDRWLDPENGFTNFYTDMGPRPSPKHSIDRIDVDGNYCPENCRWATHKEQARNKRNNKMITYAGKTLCLVEWDEEVGIPYTTIWARLRNGWSVEEALTTPVRRKKVLQ